jgi:hypothetical protein
MPIGKLLSDAVQKRPPHPLVLFLELNLPYHTAAPLFNVSDSKPYSLIHKAMQGGALLFDILLVSLDTFFA